MSSNLKILIAEDNKTIVDSILKVLASEGFKKSSVDIAFTKDELYKRSQQTTYDLILFDVYFGTDYTEKAGLDALASLRKSGWPGEAIILTSEHDDELATIAKRHNASFFVKPEPNVINIGLKKKLRDIKAKYKQGTDIFAGSSSSIKAVNDWLHSHKSDTGLMFTTGEAGTGKKRAAQYLTHPHETDVIPMVNKADLERISPQNNHHIFKTTPHALTDDLIPHLKSKALNHAGKTIVLISHLAGFKMHELLDKYDLMGQPTLSLPPLRTRTEDIESIIRDEITTPLVISKETLSNLKSRFWKHNTQDLLSLVKDKLHTTGESVITLTHKDDEPSDAWHITYSFDPRDSQSYENIPKDACVYLRYTLGWRIEDIQKCMRINMNTILKWLKEYDSKKKAS